MPHSSGKGFWCSRGTCCLCLQGKRDRMDELSYINHLSSFLITCALKMEVVYSSRMPEMCSITTQHQNPEKKTYKLFKMWQHTEYRWYNTTDRANQFLAFLWNILTHKQLIWPQQSLFQHSLKHNLPWSSFALKN